MAGQQRIKRRGFVMTGGGAKGLYEAGVIHAFHITGMEFDVITGSSIGAMNSAFFAEYLLSKRGLPAEVRADPDKAIAALDGLVKSYHHAWLLMPEKHVIDDSEEGPIGQIKDDLQKFDIRFGDLVKIGWWWTDPNRGKIPPVGVWPAVLKLGREFSERLGQVGELLRIFKDHRDAPFRAAMRSYLTRFKLDRSLIPAGDDRAIEQIFTQPISQLRPEHLTGSVADESRQVGQLYRLVDPLRTFRDYANAGLNVRLTRANYRTGRLEVSTYLSNEDFVRYMKKHAWRLDVSGPEKMPLGSFRLQLPGNPNVIKSALASGRFPGVFSPFPFRDIYPDNIPENTWLYQMLDGWLENSDVQQRLQKAYQAVLEAERAAHPDEEQEDEWEGLLRRWRESENIRDFFPYGADAYIDGGAIDNTPSNSVVDATREWIEMQGMSKRDVNLEVYVIFLEAELKVSPDEASDPALYEVVKRTLDIQSAAKQSSDAVVVKTINSFGDSGERLAQALLALLDGMEQSEGSLEPAQKEALEAAVRRIASQRGLRGYLGRESEGVLERMQKWAHKMLREGLPLNVDEIKIYPERMPLSTLQFTERFGYRKENAIDMLTMGCYNTLWAMRNHLEDPDTDLDELDQQVLKMARRWMGVENWPNKRDKEAPDQLEKISREWKCTRTDCVFHASDCPHGAQKK